MMHYKILAITANSDAPISKRQKTAATTVFAASIFKPLPIGDQNFEDIISNSRLYVDKTELILELIHGGTKYCLACLLSQRKAKILNCVSCRSFLFLNRYYLSLWSI